MRLESGPAESSYDWFRVYYLSTQGFQSIFHGHKIKSRLAALKKQTFKLKLWGEQEELVGRSCTNKRK